MGTQPFSRYITPIYVLATGALGGVIIYLLFIWNYPSPDDPIGQAFIKPVPFWIWIFILMISSCFITIFLFPLWGIFIQLFRIHTKSIKRGAIINEIFRICFWSILVIIIVVSLLQLTTSAGSSLDQYFPRGHSQRIRFMMGYSFLALLPASLGMLLIYMRSQDVLINIQQAERNEQQQIALMKDLQSYRGTLQSLLAMAGVILSMIPITAAGLRATLIAAYPEIEKIYPISYVIVYGLIFTILLLLIYIPTHLSLSEAGRTLRDSLCPVKSLDNIKDVLEKRKSLDDLLQTNIGVMQNLKSGIVTLAPLVSSFIVSLLGIDIF